MKKPTPPPSNQQIQALLKLWDDYYTALYRSAHDPERPPELSGRICRYFRQADLPNAR
jgi:hypothetical protein